MNRPTTVSETQRLVDKVAGHIRLAGSLDRYLCDAEFSDYKRRRKLGSEGVEDGGRVSEEVGMAVFLSVLVQWRRVWSDGEQLETRKRKLRDMHNARIPRGLENVVDHNS